MKTELLIHEDTLNMLEALVLKPPHALLFAGGVGTGKARLARQFCAALLNVAVADLQNQPYVRIVDPEEGTISTSTVRELAHFVSLRVAGDTSETARIILIPDAERMTREAQNALLKLLEEPPEHTVIVMTTSQPRKLLQTIRSRVQSVPIRLPEQATVATHFATQGYAAADISKAHLLAAGNIARMASILHAEDAAAMETVDIAKKLLSSDIFSRLSLIDNALKDKSVAKNVVDTLVLIASSSLERSDASRMARWQQTLGAAIAAQTALARKGNQKLVLTELMLAL
ncbi:AAA family ATPase [Candidatus Saccharibacteria bacterium]|nr:AAA family ATPase [Candidatus Saccharibacteria bacterium]